MRPTIQFLKAMAILTQIYGRQFSTEEAREISQIYFDDLSIYPENQVLEALQRCRRELRTFPTIADVIQRIDDGRPGVEEAWSQLPASESDTVVWTDEMRIAYAASSRIMQRDGDEVAARMAFKETYLKAVLEARTARKPVKWSASLGHDPEQRKRALLLAVEQKRLALPEAHALVADLAHGQGTSTALLEGPGGQGAATPVSEAIGGILDRIGMRRKSYPKPQGEPTPEEIEARRAELRAQSKILSGGES